MTKVTHLALLLLCASLVLSACSSAPTNNKGHSGKDSAALAPDGSNYLHAALLQETEAGAVKQLLREAKAATLNESNDLGHTPMHYIYAAHDWDVLMLAWDQGGDNSIETNRGETPWDWRQRLYSDRTSVDLEKAELEREQRSRVVFDSSPLAYSPWQMRLWNSNAVPQSEVAAAPPEGQHYLSNIRKRYENIATDYLRLADMETSISLVAEPEIPPALELVQDDFESDELFEERLEETIEARNKVIVALQADYQSQVELRNQQIDQLEREQSKRRQELDEQKVYFLGDAVRKELGGFRVEFSRFDKSEAKIYYALISEYSDYQQLIAIDANTDGRASIEKNRRLAEGADSIVPAVTFRINGDELELYRVRLQDSPSNDLLASNLSAATVDANPESAQSSSFASEVKRVVLDNTNIASQNIAQTASLQKQNPNIIDEFKDIEIIYTDGTRKVIDTGLQEDELWAQVQELQNSRLNENAYIFAIGVEDYANEADVPFATYSAELTTELLRIKAGVPAENVLLLTERRTTGTTIEGEFRKLLENLQANKDSTLYFYYAGHGLPTDDAVYILPSDAVTGSYIDDDFNLAGMLDKIAQADIKHSYVFLDTCFSGKTDLDTLAFKGVGAVALNPKKPKLADNFTVFYGGQASQFANAYNDKRHRMMSYYLNKGVLDGKEDILELADYVSGEVRKTAARLGPDHRQEPYVEGNTDISLF